jgi:Lipocalin-like domain
MKTLLVVLSLSFALFTEVAVAQSASPEPTVAQLLGTWQLVSVEATVTGQAQPALPYGAHPSGFLMYQPDGHMCAQLTNGEAPAWTDPNEATHAQKVAHYESFIAYCGTYKLDPKTSTVYHYPTVAWSPTYLGSTQPRPFRLEGDKLIITASKGLPDAKMEKMVLVWQRAKPATTQQ